MNRIVAVVAACVLAPTAWYWWPAIPRRPKTPADLREAEVFKNELATERRILLKDSRLGPITDILAPISSSSRQIRVVGELGAVVADLEGNVRLELSFSTRRNSVRFVDVEGDRRLEFLDRSEGWHGGALLDHQGKLLWELGGIAGVDDVAPGDLDGDGILQFAVGWNGDGGIHLLDRAGKARWNNPVGNVWHVEVVDTDHDGAPETGHSDAERFLAIRNRHGKVPRAIKDRESRGSYEFGSSLRARVPGRARRAYRVFV